MTLCKVKNIEHGLIWRTQDLILLDKAVALGKLISHYSFSICLYVSMCVYMIVYVFLYVNVDMSKPQHEWRSQKRMSDISACFSLIFCRSTRLTLRHGTSGFAWVLGIETHIPMLSWQAIYYIPNHLPNPEFSFFNL